MVWATWSNDTLCGVSSTSLRGDPIDILIVSFVLVMGAIVIFAYATRVRSAVRKEKKSYGVPDGLILYSDLNVLAVSLFSKRFLLTGKPDYVVRKENQCIPVEMKSGGGAYPYQSQVIQLAAYCQILEDTSGEFVPAGILVNNNITYTIPFNPKLRFELESVMKTMRTSLRTGFVQRNHHDSRRCKYCSMRRYCADPVQDDL